MSKKRCHFCEDLKMLKSKVDTPSEIKSVYLATLVRKLMAGLKAGATMAVTS